MEMCNLGVVKSHGKKPFKRVTLDPVSARNCAASSPEMLVARFSVLRARFHNDHARSYAARWFSETFLFSASHTCALFLPILQQSRPIGGPS